jgi:hypothetical protein
MLPATSPSTIGRLDFAGEPPAGKGEIFPCFPELVVQKALWAELRSEVALPGWAESTYGDSSRAQCLLLISIRINSNSNQVQTSKIYSNLMTFDKIINALP